MAASHSPDEHTNLLSELGIPGRTKDPISTNPDVWGLNIAAVLDLFPRHGLQCTAGPWGRMAEGDSLVIFWGPGNQVLQKTVEKNEVNTQLRLFVEPRHILPGNFDVSYTVAPLGQTAEPSEVMKVFVKLTRPGGKDDNDEPGHSRLIMHIPREILEGGIDSDNVAAGVDIGIEPYPNIFPGDVIRLSWGGVFVSSPPLTQDQADGKTPIVIHVDEATIRKAGDSDSTGVTVVFEVYDKVDNRSEDWSAAQRVVVSIDTTRPLAPLLKETLNNLLDLDKLGDAKGTGQVVAVDGKVFAKGDTVFLQLKGAPVEGTPIDHELPGMILESVPSVLEIPIDNALLRRFATVQMVLFYRIEKADGSADISSKGQFISVIGQLQRLKAPIAEDAEQGALDPDLAYTRIEIPWDEAFEAGQAIKPFWLGTLPDFTPYLPDLPLRPITNGDVNDKVSLYITVDSAHIKVLEGGTLELYYQLLSDDGVLAELDHYSAINAIRESEHAPLLAVGEPRLELPMPRVEGVVDNVLDPDRNGTTLSATWLNTLVGDKVTREWVGSKTGPDSDWIILNSFTAGREVPFPISADLIKGNEDGTVQARYFVEREEERTRYSQPLDFNVGAPQALDPPTITQVVDSKGAAIADGGTTVDTTVTLSGAGAKGQKVQIKDGTTVKGEATVNQTTGLWELTVTGLSVTAHSFTAIALYGEGTVSTPWTLTVTANTAPTITQAVDSKGAAIANGGTTVDTEVTLSGAGAKGQKVQIKDGDTFKGEATINLTTGLWELTVTGLSVTAHSFTAIALYGEGKVSTPWALTVTANTAPTITQAVDSKGAAIADGGTTVDTTVTLSGAGAKGQKVQIKDGDTVTGEATINLTTSLWEWTMTDLSVGDHHFTATALYGEGKISEARTLKIIPYLIIIDPATMVLGGVRLINDYGWERRAETNTVKRCEATGGVAPYTYTSANSAIASVSNNGAVTGFRQGSTTITVKDKNGGQGQFTVQCNEIKIYKVVKSPGLMAGTYEAITGWIRSVGGITEVEHLRELADNFNVEYPDARIVLGPPYPAYPASSLLSWGYYASFPETPEVSAFLNAMPPPNETLFFTNSAYVGEQLVPGYFYALVPV